MSDRTSRFSLPRSSLSIVLASVLAAGLGGCATFRMGDLVNFGGAQSCKSDAWGTEVMGSVQRVSTEPDIPYQPEPKYTRVAEREPEWTVEARPAPIVEEPTRQLPEDSVPAAESKPEPPLSESQPAPLAEARPEPAPSTQPSPAPPSAEPSEAQSPPVEEKVARLPEPITPKPEPLPEVVKVCGPNDTECQEQLAELLSDPVHKWIGQRPTPEQQETGVRLLAYRVLTPVLACDDLRKARDETEGPGPDEAASEEWMQLLRRAVNLELKAEIAKRC